MSICIKEMEHLQEYSKGFCVSRCVPQMIGAVVFLAVSILFATIDVNDREKVDVTIQESKSSHKRGIYKTDVSTTQNIIIGKKVTPQTSTVQEEYFVTEGTGENRRRVKKVRTKCLGDRYEFSMDGEKMYATCPGHQGACNGPLERELVYDSSNGIVMCKPHGFQYNCSLNADVDGLTQSVNCTYPLCPSNGEIEYPVRLADNKIECPKRLRGNFNKCSMKIKHGNKLYDRVEHTNGICEDFINKNRKLYYSDETDNFKDNWNPPYTYLKTVSTISFLISCLCAIHIVLIVKVDLYCHAQNVAKGVNMAKTQVSQIQY